nr:hypothetical protein [Tanacetum cinerariifolium]
DKGIAISELKKLIEKLKGKSVETKFEKSSVIQLSNAFKSQRPSILGKQTIFSYSLERKDCSKSKLVTKNNVSNDFSKPVTAHILPLNKKSILKNTNVLAPGMYKLHTKPIQTRTTQLPHNFRKTNKRVSFSTGAIPTTSVSRPQLKSNRMEDRVMLNNSQGKKQEVEDHRRNVMFSKNKTFVTACNDCLNAKTSNVNFICATCGKCVSNVKHDMRVLHSFNGVNSRTKMPIAVLVASDDLRGALFVIYLIFAHSRLFPGPEHVDDEIIAEDQSFAEDALPISQSLEYVSKFDLKAYPEEDDDEDSEEDPEGSLEDDEDDDMDIEADEEEEHSVPADSVVARLLAMSTPPSSPLSPLSSPSPWIPFPPLPPILSPPSPTLSPAPPPSPIHSLGHRAAMIRMRAEAASTSHPPPLPPPFILSHTKSDAPSSGIPPPLPISAPTSLPPSQLPSASHREDRPEVTLPPQKRLGIALGPGYEVGESSSTADRPAGGLRADYDFVATIDREIRHDLGREARLSREAWVRSMDASDLARGEVMSLCTTVLCQTTENRELHAAVRRRQIVTSEMLSINRKRFTEIRGLRTADRTRQLQLIQTLTVIQSLQRQAMIDQGIIDALASHDALRCTNGDDNHNSGTGVKRTERATHEFENQVKFATYTLHSVALTWLNTHVKTVGHDAAYGMPWKTLMKMMTDKYCPQNEIKKLGMEIWDLKVKGTDLTSYSQRFQELALLCGRMFLKESDKIERYIGGLPDMIHGSVVTSKPKIMQEAVEIATELMDKKICTFAERETASKRKFENTSRSTQNQQQQPNKRQNTGRVYTAASGEKKQYGGSKPLCIKCNYHHDGPCAPKCHKCNKVGHFFRDCRSTANTNNVNNQRGTGDNVPAKVYAVGRAGTDPDSNVVTVPSSHRVCWKIVRILWGNETLIIHGDGNNQGNATRLNIISCTKTDKYMMKVFPIFLAHVTTKEVEDKSEKKRLEDVPIVQNFPEVFPEDLPGLPLTRLVEFQIDLVPGAAPVARAPCGLAPSEMKELSK